MKPLILAAAALALSAFAANADEIITHETQTGVHSAPVAGATPQARENPAPGTTMLEQRERTTVEHRPSTVVEEQRTTVVPAQPRVEEPARSSY